MQRSPNWKLLGVALVAWVPFLGLSVWGWGDWRGLFAHPARLGLFLGGALMTGASTFSNMSVGAGTRENRRNRWIFIPLMLFGLAFPWFTAYADRRNLWTLDGDAARYLGLLLFLLGGTLRVWAVFVLGRQFSPLLTIQEGHRLVTDSVYRVIRHPSYTGALLAMAGWALGFRSSIGLLLTLMLVVVVVLRIPTEEALLLSEFGEQYAAYQKHTWRLIPFIY